MFSRDSNCLLDIPKSSIKEKMWMIILKRELIYKL